MNIFYLLIGVSLLAALIFLAAFIWAVRTGQFEDNETPAIRVLFDDDTPSEDAEEDKIESERDKKTN
ncbi:MAG: cbb3-type cytochrome oxidase assembly protein CcoS [Prolixibacteraceae bacterium]|nr:cbb3-type cytochrome oxidase assembly protein CcoS [Prolixibacteraceae bacterium]